MFKKRINLTIAFLMFFLIITGCSKVEDSKGQNINDKSVVVNSFNPNSYSNQIEVSSSLDFEKIYNNIDELYNNSINVIYGTVRKVEYIDDSGAALTCYDFVVERSYKGELQENDMITVLATGGYVRLQKFIEVFGDGKFKDFSETKRSQTVLKENPMGAPLPKVDDKYLVFLSNPIKNEAPFPDGAYVERGSFMGRYYYEGDKLVRYKPADEPDFYSDTNDRYTLKEVESILEKQKNE